MAIDFRLLLKDITAAEFTPLEYIRAHQYLYYCKPESVVLTDREFDLFSQWTLLGEGKGGSDSKDDYTLAERTLAVLLVAGTKAPFPDYYEEKP